jgi:hypothetical protein
MGFALALTAVCAAVTVGCGDSDDDTNSQFQAVIDGLTRDVFVGNGITGRRQLFHLPLAGLTVQRGAENAETVVPKIGSQSSRA